METAKKKSSIDSPRIWPKLMILLAVILFAGASWMSSALKGLPGNGTPQQPFDFSRIVGNWYEIARLENDLEEDFGQATLKVVQSSNNKLEVTLSDPKTKSALPFNFEYDSNSKVGSAFLSCWGPLMCGYHVIAMDKKDLSWMMVAGHTLDELWLFARAPGLPPEVLKKLLSEVQALGYDTDNLVVNNKPPEIVVKPVNKGDQSSPSIGVPSYPLAPVPETPANEPPVPLHIPEVPTTIPAIPKDIPTIPRDIPQFGKQGPPSGIPIEETPEVSNPKTSPKKPQNGKDR